MNRRLMMQQQAKKRLPADYTELQYITSDGRQWFDTGVYADGYTGARYKYSVSRYETYSGYVLSGSGFPAFPFFRNYIGNEIRITRDKAISIKHSYSLNTPYEFFVTESGEVYLDNELITSIGNVTVNTTEATIVMATYYGQKDATYGLKGNIYYCQIFQNGEIVRDYVSCKNPQGVVGMYDLVEGIFYKSNHSQGFGAGDEV